MRPEYGRADRHAAGHSRPGLPPASARAYALPRGIGAAREAGMQTQSGPVRPKAYWWVGILALVWNLIGLAMFFVQVGMDEARLATLSEAERQILLATPPWVNVAFAFAVIGGVLGALCLLLRRRWAVPMFLVSLLALLVQFGGAYLVTPAWQAYGPPGLAMPALLFVIALFLWRYARRSAACGWLR